MIPGSLIAETAVTKERRKSPLGSCVRTSLQRYFNDLHGHTPENLYDMVIREIEIPLLETALKHSKGKQSKAAQLLGINRGTLRKKLRQYNLL